MSSGSKKRHSEKRKAQKKAKKAQKKALYASYAGTGKKKKKLQGRNIFGCSPQKGNHPQVPCGNIACKKCYIKIEILKQKVAA